MFSQRLMHRQTHTHTEREKVLPKHRVFPQPLVLAPDVRFYALRVSPAWKKKVAADLSQRAATQTTSTDVEEHPDLTDTHTQKYHKS